MLEKKMKKKKKRNKFGAVEMKYCKTYFKS